VSAKAEPAGKGGTQAAGDGTATTLSYEQARDQLTEVVRRLEGGGLTLETHAPDRNLALEQSLDLWERGERLAAICEQWLEGARARLAAAMAARTPETADRDAPF
jgi:exodeoxyribonuclease VII small subunit